MNRQAHVITGAAIGCAIAYQQAPEIMLVCGAVGGYSAMLPDQLEAGIWEHRKMTHSLFTVAALACGLLTVPIGDYYRWTILSAYVSHLILDAITVTGIWWLHPFFKYRLRLIPNKKLAPRTGGGADSLVSVIGSVAMIGMVITRWEAVFTIPERLVYLLTRALN
jgi:membrane-bound metal-dependent hydrolase YbcI (DUF457 family)